MDQTTIKARKLLLWNVPLIVLLIIPLSVWFLIAELFPTINDVLGGASVVRIYPGSLVAPLVTIAMIVTVVMVVLKAIPVSDALFKKVVWLITALWCSALPLLLLSMLLGHPAQQFYFPKHGYTQCDLLHGNPTIWFTDWVKNPAWCVRGKDRSWVFEQARLAREGEAANPDVSVTK